MTDKVTIRRAMSVTELYSRRRTIYKLEGELADLIGAEVELRGAWFIWGGSNSGKTAFACQLAKELSKYKTVAYNSIEEGDSLTMTLALKRVQMQDVGSRFLFLDAEPIEELDVRLAKHKSPGIVIIDSFQYARLRYQQFIDLVGRHPSKLFIFISQAKGKEPSGADAEAAKYAASVKIWVEGCRAFAQSRYGGGKPYTIYEERAHRYWDARSRSIEEE